MAGDINHVVLVGRLTRDVDLKYTPSGSAVASMSLAINRRRKSGDQWVDEANYFDITLWGRSAEGLAPYLKKGTRIGVDGELHQNRWEQEGQKRSKVDIVASNIQLLGNSGGGNGGSGGDYANRGTTDYSSAASNQFSNQFAPESPVAPRAIPSVIPDDFDDDIPF